MSHKLVKKWEIIELTSHVFVMRKDIITKTNEIVMVCASEKNIRIFQENAEFITMEKFKKDPIYFAINENRLLVAIDLFTLNEERDILVQEKITDKLFHEQEIIEMAYSHSLYFDNFNLLN